MSKWPRACAAVACILFVCSTCFNGPPALRHDWNWSTAHESFVAALAGSVSAWKPDNFGYPTPYPTDWILALPTSLLGLLLGPNATLWLFIAAVAVVLAGGAWSLARTFGATPASAAIAASFALLNPWTYSEIVAGHTYLIISVGGLMGLFAELLREKPGRRAATLWIALIVPQAQIALVTGGLLLFYAVVKRRVLPLVSFAVLWSPTVIAVVLERRQFLQIPYNLVWEQAQSLHVADALSLCGYFAHYTDPGNVLFRGGTGVLAAISAAGIFLARRNSAVLGVAIAGALGAVLALGAYGPFPALFDYVVRRVPETGVFRELYDLLAFLLIAYAVGVGIASDRSSAFAVGAGTGVLLLAAAWIVHPPALYFTDARSLPVVKIQSRPNTRFALMPAFQPLQYQGRGSGLDHDLYVRPGNIQPLNAGLPTYPVDVALASYVLSGDARRLEALSVSRVVARPWYSSDQGSLRPQRAMTGRAGGIGSSRALRAIPMLSLAAGTPQGVTVADDLWASGVFFGDERPSQVVIPVASGTSININQAWVDARLAFAAEPKFGQGFGGVLTSSTSPLDVPPRARYALVRITGALRSTGGKLVSAATSAYRWRAVTGPAVQCFGQCAIAAFAATLPSSPTNGPRMRWAGVSFSQPLPWLALATLPAHGSATLRFNVRFDNNWVALVGERQLHHVALDRVVNAWKLHADGQSEPVIIVEVASALQSLAMALSLVYVIALTTAPEKRRA